MATMSNPIVVSIGSSASRSFTISCDACVARDTSACADCVVSHVLALDADQPDHAVSFDDEEWAAVDLLVEAGLLPTLRHHEATPPHAGR
jgi:hypothetical protein